MQPLYSETETSEASADPAPSARAGRPLGFPAFAASGTTIFEVMSALAAETGAVNLGQGFPDEDGPLPMREAAARALLDGPNQYPRMMGVDALRRAVAVRDGIEGDETQDVLVTSGATEALAAAMLALLNPGDEALLFAPTYDCYAPMIARAGATARFVPLHAPDWRLDEAELSAAITDRTRLIVLNTPHNPTGKVFSRDELAAIGRLADRHDLTIVSDEVYEHLTLDGRRHVSPAHLPGLAGRTLRIGSAGKTFSMTGWKVGYARGPKPLIALLAKAHQFTTFTTPPALQIAVAHGFEACWDFVEALPASLAARRDRLAEGLADLGLDTLPVEGGYFLTADARPLMERMGATTDAEVALRLTREAGVASVPISAFYPNSVEAPTHLLRFCFCKRDDVIAEAVDRLSRAAA